MNSAERRPDTVERARAIVGAGVAVFLALLLGGCAAGAPDRREEVAPMTDELKAKVQAALVDATRRTGLAESALEVVEARNVVWPDGSLGCPEPGKMYTMALVPGYRIRIRAGAEVLDYHGAARGQPALCPPGRATAPSGPASRI